MTVISSTKDQEALTLTLIAEFDASADRVWQVWEDPRQLERWWGPPTWPATFAEHDLVAGGRSHYYMTGPDGTEAHGWWAVTDVDAPHRVEFDDGFADADGNPTDDGMTTHSTVSLEGREGGGTRMTILSSFPSLDVLDKMVEMGMQDGLRQAVGQIDAIVAEPAR